MIYKSTHLSCNLSPSLVLNQSLYHVFYIYIYNTFIRVCMKQSTYPTNLIGDFRMVQLGN